jgi:hypothetical protein
MIWLGTSALMIRITVADMLRINAGSCSAQIYFAPTRSPIIEQFHGWW